MNQMENESKTPYALTKSKSQTQYNSIDSNYEFPNGLGPKRSSSGFLSFFKWFKKSTDLDSASTSSRLSKNPSLESLYSTATVASFTYVNPDTYRPFGEAKAPQKLITPGPETETLKKRIKQLEKAREKDKNTTLRKKYKLFSYDNKSKSLDENRKHSNNNYEYSERSLPLIREVKETKEKVKEVKNTKKKRRTVSDSSKDKKAGAYVHVKGKRRAPSPPKTDKRNSDNIYEAINVDNKRQSIISNISNISFGTIQRKKRPAPPPPKGSLERSSRSLHQAVVTTVTTIEVGEQTEGTDAEINVEKTGKPEIKATEKPKQPEKRQSPSKNLTPEQKNFLIENIVKLQNNAKNTKMNNVKNDSQNQKNYLKIEGGMLKQTKPCEQKEGAKPKETAPASPILAPKPWYKRNSEQKGVKKSDNTKKEANIYLRRNEKINEKSKNVYQPAAKEKGTTNKNSTKEKTTKQFSSIFSRFSINLDDKRKEENRKSGVHLLANISELDREAGIIAEKERLSKGEDYFIENTSDPPNSTKELITKFNALTENGVDKQLPQFQRRFSYFQSNDFKRDIKDGHKVAVTPPMKRSIFNLGNRNELFREKTELDLFSSRFKRLDEEGVYQELNFNSKKEELGWICTTCNSKNPITCFKCKTCGMWKPFERCVNYKKKKTEDTEKKEIEKVTEVEVSTPENETQTARKFAESVFKVLEEQIDEEIKSSQNDNKEKLETKKVTIIDENENKNKNMSEEQLKLRQMLKEMKNSLPKKRKSLERSSMLYIDMPEQEFDAIMERGRRVEENKDNDDDGVDEKCENIEVEGSFETLDNQIKDKSGSKLNGLKENITQEEENEGGQKGPWSDAGGLKKYNPIAEVTKTSANQRNDFKKPIIVDEIFKTPNNQIKIDGRLETKEILNAEKDEAEEKAIRKEETKKEIVDDELLKQENEAIKRDAEKEMLKIMEENELLDENKQLNNHPTPNKQTKQTNDFQEKQIQILTQTIVYENIKVKHENTTKPLKISCGSQTKGQVQPERPKITDKSSLSRKNSFELIRPIDFVDIAVNPNLYTNIPSTIEELSPQRKQSSSSEDDLMTQLSDLEGVRDFRATLKLSKHDVNTLTINGLLKRLENAIANGQHILAAKLARDLARLKVNCSVTRQKKESGTQYVMADMYIEDQVSHQGPIPLRVRTDLTIRELKLKITEEFEIPTRVQRWILNKQLGDDDGTLADYDVVVDGFPMFLYLVAPDNNTENTIRKGPQFHQRIYPNLAEELAGNDDLEDFKALQEEAVGIDYERLKRENLTLNDIGEEYPVRPKRRKAIEETFDPSVAWKCPACTLINSIDRPGCEACSQDKPMSQQENAHYLKLFEDLDKQDLVPNHEPFECKVCLVDCDVAEGVVLRECLHSFCRECLALTIEHSDEAVVKCPYRDEVYSCETLMQDREIKALVSKDVFEQHLSRSMKQAENVINNSFHCKTPDCQGWCIYEDNVNIFNCPVCRKENCLTCQAVHLSMNCKQYQDYIRVASKTNEEAKKTQNLLDEMVGRGEAMICPSCQIVLMKKWGCDWLKCTMCKAEICWVTRGLRWGPDGKGDVSGGCKCGVNGVKCHPKCTYCH